MTQEEKSGTDKNLEGEGSYTATRQYNKGLAQHQKTADVEKLAEEASEALDGEEGEELRDAEERGKRGPTADADEKRRQSGQHRKP